MVKYIKLLGVFIRASLLTELEYRANFIAQIFLGLLWAVVVWVSVLIFFAHTTTLGGWEYAQVLIVVGMFSLINGLIECMLAPNVKRLIEMVRLGTLDFVLLKPVSSQFMTTLRYTRFNGIGDFSAGVLTIIYAFGQMTYRPSLEAIVQFACVFLMACLTVYSIWVFIATASFWLVKVNNLTELFRSIYDTGRFPITTFQGGVRFFLTYVMPIAFITTFPAQAFLGKLDAATTLTSVAIAAITFIASNRFWNFAIRNYSSASS
ncbi:MAG: ABC-2 family transporter protein [Anaerolineae bacterium]|nr:ABC-2 family transporter protein [Anaerolineae bacterium]